MHPRNPAAAAYAYLLGIYLGDGYLFRHPRTWRLHVYQDAAYPQIVGEIASAMRIVGPARTVSVYKRDSECVDISSYSKHWPELFPQHGRGRKHERLIVMEPWQRRVLDADPRPFIRGLIHSDGCRSVARQRVGDRVYEYPRYFFSNRSDDIRGLFCEYLERLGVGWTQPGQHQIQIARRDAVATMEAFIGPKR